MDIRAPILEPRTDHSLLIACRRWPGAESFHPLLSRYLRYVYAHVRRRTSDLRVAEEITRAVFLTFARRAHKLSARTVLADWLHHVTELACLKQLGRHRTRLRKSGLFARAQAPSLDSAALSTAITHELDRALTRLSTKQRQSVLLGSLLRQQPEVAALSMRCSPARWLSAHQKGSAKLQRYFRSRGISIDSADLDSLLGMQECAGEESESFESSLLEGMTECVHCKPRLALARRTLASLAWQRWRRRVAWGIPLGLLSIIGTLATLWHYDARTGHSHSVAAFIIWASQQEAKKYPEVRRQARPWGDMSPPPMDATGIAHSRDFYRTTNIWRAELRFTPDAWEALEPKRIHPLPHFFQPDGSILLRNPEAQRSGLAGVLGFDFNWSSADLAIGGRAITNVGVRIKGNGTYLSSLASGKRSLKVGIDKYNQGRRWDGIQELNFHSLLDDRSYMSDALAYEFFRDAGVPAPRTAYAWLQVSVDGGSQKKPLGLFAMIEPVDGSFLLDRFGTKNVPLFKPVTYQLFEDLGLSWTDYAAPYDLKTKATSNQLQRVVDFSQLVSHASPETFDSRLPEFLDLEGSARFFAGIVMLSCYDSILANGQNYYLYLDPRSNRFGFIPWDMDMAWGGFFLMGTPRDRERASIWHPWVGKNRFLERVLQNRAFRETYRAELESLLTRLFVPERLRQRVDELAGILRSPVAAESDFRSKRFEVAVGTGPGPSSTQGEPQGVNRPVHQLKRFFEARARSVRQQLDGESEGIVLQRTRGE